MWGQPSSNGLLESRPTSKKLFHFDCFGVTQPFSHSNRKEVSSGLKADSLTARLDHLPKSTCRHYACGWLCSRP